MGNGYRVGAVAHGSLQQIQRLFGQNELRGVVRAQVRAAVAHQFVGVGGHKREAVSGKLEKYAAHDGPQIVVTGREQGFLNGRGQHVSR